MSHRPVPEREERQMNEKERRMSGVQTARIAYYETLLDEITEKMPQAREDADVRRRLQPLAKELEHYYESGIWRQDFEDDEAGRIPADLKRGVLSEDAVFNVLTELAGLEADEENGLPKPYVHIVQYYETDKMGIAHHSNYIRWMEEARVDYLNKIGFPYIALEEDGIYSPMVAVHCRYRRPTRFGDAVTIQARVVEFKGLRLILGYRMTNAEGQAVFEGTTESCFSDENGKVIRLEKYAPEYYRMFTEQAGIGE